MFVTGIWTKNERAIMNSLSNSMYRMRYPAMLAALAAILIIGSQTVAAPILWSVASGGNGHWYEAVLRPAGIEWDEAEAEAVMREGHLAGITSAAENQFVFSLVNSPEYWWHGGIVGDRGPWLGGFQPIGTVDTNPAANWHWATGDSWSYTNWYGAGTEPNGRGEQSFLQFTGAPDVGQRSAYWNDTGRSPPDPAVYGYVIEWSTNPRGDLNNDCMVNNQDIREFVLALTYPDIYALAYPTINLLSVGDLNNDNTFNNQDVAPFVALLTGNGLSLSSSELSELNSIPEPTSLGLLLLGGLLTIRKRK